jgi:Cro/C1-type HTH DNA-binding domain
MSNPDTEDDDGVQAKKLPSSRITPEGFVPLVMAVMERDHIKHCDLARRTGLSESKISRTLGQRRPIDTTTLHIIFDALGIDLMRALLAVGHFGDWDQYFDPDVEVIADLIGVLPMRLAQARCGSERAKISPAGTVFLADKLSEMIVKNDRETFRRRREQPIAGM